MADNAAIGRGQWPGMNIFRFSGPHRHPILTVLLLGLLPFTASPACWDIAMPGKTVTATDVWQIRNRVSGDAVLLGKSGGERHAVALERVRSFTVAEDTQSGWISGHRDAVELEIRLVDGRTTTLVSELNLYYRIENQRHAVPLGGVLAVHRCDDPSAAVPSPPEVIDPQPASPFLVMKNGDRLYGNVAGDQLGWQTAYASVGFKPAQLKLIKAGCEAPSSGTLETLAGDLLNGSFIDPSLLFHLTTGQSMDIPTRQIRVIDFTGMQAADPRIAEACRNDR